MDEGAWRKLTPSSKLKYLEVEKNIRKTHLEITKTMSITELKALKKHEYRDLMKKEMYDMVPQLTETVVHTACHYISNAVSNLRDDLLKERKKGTKPSTDGKGDPAVDRILPKNLSESFQKMSASDDVLDDTFNSDLHDVMFSTDDSITIEKEIAASNVDKTTKTKTKSVRCKKQDELTTDTIECICKATSNDHSIIKCDWYQEWYHDSCMGINRNDQIGFWVCVLCRKLPQTVNKIESLLEQVVKTNGDLLDKLTKKTEELSLLQSENDRLRTIVDRSNAWNTISTTTICTENDLFDQPEKVDDGTDNKANKCSKQEPSGTLLTGSSIIRDITKKKYNLDSVPICVRGGVISDITAQLLQLPTDTSLKNIILQVGSNDCVNHNFDIKAFGEDYLNLVKVSKSICENVVVSGLCPRLDDREANINRGNIILQNIANDENCYFVDNDTSFRLLSGSINIKLYRNDGIHLNELGTEKLANNLDIVKKVLSSDNNFTQKTVRESVSNVKIDRSKQGNKLYNDKQSNGKFQNHSRGNVSHNDRSNDFSVDSNAHVYSNRWGNSNNNKDRYRSHNLNRHEKQTNCWFCNETGHTSATCRHGKYVQCFGCRDYGHKAKHCTSQ
jgi:hypothetical protein